MTPCPQCETDLEHDDLIAAAGSPWEETVSRFYWCPQTAPQCGWSHAIACINEGAA